MTNTQKAIATLRNMTCRTCTAKTQLHTYSTFFMFEEGDICNMCVIREATKALEKQIPMEPKAIPVYGDGWHECPTCKKAIKQRIGESKHDIQHCLFCGQKLEWEKDEESEDDESVGLTD